MKLSKLTKLTKLTSLADRFSETADIESGELGWGDSLVETDAVEPSHLPDSYDPEKRLFAAIQAASDDGQTTAELYAMYSNQAKEAGNQAELQKLLYNVASQLRNLAMDKLNQFRDGNTSWKSELHHEFKAIYRNAMSEAKRNRLHLNLYEINSFRVLNLLSGEAVPVKKLDSDLNPVFPNSIQQVQRRNTSSPEISEEEALKIIQRHMATEDDDETATVNYPTKSDSEVSKITETNTLRTASIINLANKFTERAFHPEELDLESESDPMDDDPMQDHPLDGMPVAPNKSNYEVLTDPVKNFNDEESQVFKDKAREIFATAMDEFNEIRELINKTDTFEAESSLKVFIDKCRGKTRKALYDLVTWYKFDGGIDNIQSEISELRNHVRALKDIRHALLNTWDAHRGNNLDEKTIQMISKLSRAADRAATLGKKLVTEIESALSSSFKKYQGDNTYEFESEST